MSENRAYRTQVAIIRAAEDITSILVERGMDEEVARTAAPTIAEQIARDDPDLTVTDEGLFYELLVAVAKHRR